MPFNHALSLHPEAAVAVGEVVGAALEACTRWGARPDLALLFVSPAHLASIDLIASTVQTLLDPAVFVGSSAVGVLAGDAGVEVRPGLALWTASWPDRPEAARRIRPVALEPDGNRSVSDPWGLLGWGGEHTQSSQLLLVADPTSFSTEEFLAQLAQSHPTMPVIGGFASTAHTPAGNRLIIGGRVVRSGAVGVLVPEPLMAPPVVSQGCRPIGEPMTVTKSNDNVIYELAGRPALDRVLEMLEHLDADERALAELGLHCGIVVDERKERFGRGDFLIRGVLGASKEHRAVVVGDRAPIGCTVQFQVRDAVTSGEDLDDLLLAQAAEADAALLFTCNGRGQAMFGDSSHDAAAVARRVPGAVAGMFCAGEIGPIGGRNALHGFTASLALFRA